MNEWWLIGCFLVLTCFALLVVTYPLRKNRSKGFVVFISLFVIAAGVAYRQWGAWPLWQHYTVEQAKQEEAKALLATIKSPEELVEKLRAKLDDTPKSAKGWYLLGRLYASQDQWLPARDAFLKSHQLNAEDELTTINYAESLWQLNQQQFNSQIRLVFVDLLQKNPNQPDALAMLAMDAFTRHDYPQAVMYWQKLLKLAPPQSEEAKAIRKAIAKAKGLQG
jgi:cytochrome c-type biogenesis protein CcmH